MPSQLFRPIITIWGYDEDGLLVLNKSIETLQEMFEYIKKSFNINEEINNIIAEVIDDNFEAQERMIVLRRDLI